MAFVAASAPGFSAGLQRRASAPGFSAGLQRRASAPGVIVVPGTTTSALAWASEKSSVTCAVVVLGVFTAVLARVFGGDLRCRSPETFAAVLRVALLRLAFIVALGAFTSGLAKVFGGPAIEGLAAYSLAMPDNETLPLVRAASAGLSSAGVSELALATAPAPPPYSPRQSSSGACARMRLAGEIASFFAGFALPIIGVLLVAVSCDVASPVGFPRFAASLSGTLTIGVIVLAIADNHPATVAVCAGPVLLVLLLGLLAAWCRA